MLADVYTRAIREMLSKGLDDPYTRFVTREEFSSLVKYDVSGVGMNVGTADDFVKNTVCSLDKNLSGL